MRERVGRRLWCDSLGSVGEFQLETRVMCSPGLEVEVELAAPLALGGSVGDDHLERVIADLVGKAAPASEELPELGAEGWIGESHAHGEESRRASSPVRGPRLTADRCPAPPFAEAPRLLPQVRGCRVSAELRHAP
jgi:hypothetical protein